MPAPRFKIEQTDGTEREVKMLPLAQIAYERETGKSLGGDFGEQVTDLYKLAWFADGAPGEFDQWIEGIEAVTGVDQEEADGDPLPTTEQSPD